MAIPPIPPRRDGMEIDRNQEDEMQQVQEAQDPQPAAEDLLNQAGVPVAAALAGVQDQLAILWARELEIPGEIAAARQREDAAGVGELEREAIWTRQQIQELEEIAAALNAREPEENQNE